MQTDEIITFEQSIAFAVEKTAIYYRLKAAQLFNANKYAITPEQYCVLESLYHSGDEEVCQRDISKKILKDRSNTSRILNILEDKGFISRTINTKQKRLVKTVEITQEGKVLYARISPEIKDAFLQTVDGVLDEELFIVKKVLERIRENLSKETTIQI